MIIPRQHTISGHHRRLQNAEVTRFYLFKGKYKRSKQYVGRNGHFTTHLRECMTKHHLTLKESIYEAENKMACSRTQRSTSGNARSFSQALRH